MEFPPSVPVPDDIKMIIVSLLNSNPEHRPSIDDVLEHPFFKSHPVIKQLPVSALVSVPVFEEDNFQSETLSSSSSRKTIRSQEQAVVLSPSKTEFTTTPFGSNQQHQAYNANTANKIVYSIQKTSLPIPAAAEPYLAPHQHLHPSSSASPNSTGHRNISIRPVSVHLPQALVSASRYSLLHVFVSRCLFAHLNLFRRHGQQTSNALSDAIYNGVTDSSLSPSARQNNGDSLDANRPRSANHSPNPPRPNSVIITHGSTSRESSSSHSYKSPIQQRSLVSLEPQLTSMAAPARVKRESPPPTPSVKTKLVIEPPAALESK